MAAPIRLIAANNQNTCTQKSAVHQQIIKAHACQHKAVNKQFNERINQF